MISWNSLQPLDQISQLLDMSAPGPRHWPDVTSFPLLACFESMIRMISHDILSIAQHQLVFFSKFFYFTKGVAPSLILALHLPALKFLAQHQFAPAMGRFNLHEIPQVVSQHLIPVFPPFWSCWLLSLLRSTNIR
ncbi:Uncharacterized protein HZ326_17584 [Fusarium oxysporum f. sp. albedinis]|nr:Uncharacterized protein HZ326_17584 [Fusarium oxysporum f. sp. albedinis]